MLVLLKLLSEVEPGWSFAELAASLRMSASEVHASTKRCELAGLYRSQRRQVNRLALTEFLTHGLRYVFPAQPGAMMPGLPTSYGAPILKKHFLADNSEMPVMPLLSGSARGPEIAPLYRTAPEAAAQDQQLYNLLALVDAVRSGRVRERKLAQELLARELTAR